MAGIMDSKWAAGEPLNMESFGESLPRQTSGDEDTGLSCSRDEARAKVKQHQWVAKVPLNYELYNQTDNRQIMNADGEPAWLMNAVKYEWKEEFGEVGPENPVLETQLYHSEHTVRRGQELSALNLKVTSEGPVQIKPVRTFDDAGLHPIMRRNVQLCNYDMPTPIQAWTMPTILAGFDMIASAQTGSGKTAGYLIPIISKLMGKAKSLRAQRLPGGSRAEPLVLVLCPTRELALQVFDEARRLCYRSMLRPCVVYGGAPAALQRDDIKKGCDIMIATLGRLCDFLDQNNLISLGRVKFTVFDEADKILQEDWDESTTKVFSGSDMSEDADNMFLMFSATFPKSAQQVAKKYISMDHVRIHVGRIGSTHKNIRQQVVWVDDDKKRQAVFDLLTSLPPARTIVFVHTKRTCELLDDFLFGLDLPTTSLHSDRSQLEREDAIAFRRGKCPILIATGLSARGIDVKNVMHVINYDLPDEIDEYIHRIGRTARIGNSGLATSFFNEKNLDIAECIVKVMMENGQEVPDFLAEFKPADGIVVWSDNEDAEGDADAGGKTVAGAVADDEADRPAETLPLRWNKGASKGMKDTVGEQNTKTASPEKVEPATRSDGYKWNTDLMDGYTGNLTAAAAQPEAPNAPTLPNDEGEWW